MLLLPRASTTPAGVRGGLQDQGRVQAILSIDGPANKFKFLKVVPAGTHRGYRSRKFSFGPWMGGVELRRPSIAAKNLKGRLRISCGKPALAEMARRTFAPVPTSHAVTFGTRDDHFSLPPAIDEQVVSKCFRCSQPFDEPFLPDMPLADRAKSA